MTFMDISIMSYTYCNLVIPNDVVIIHIVDLGIVVYIIVVDFG